MKEKLKTLNEKLLAANTIAMFAHKNPDGDALCSVLALSRLIELNFGKKSVCMYDGNITDALDNVPLRNRIKYCGRVDMTAGFDLAVALDYGTVRNLGGASAALDKAKFCIEMDHHINDNPIGALSFSDVKAAAAGEVVFHIMESNNWKYDADVIDLLALSILTDTGFFKYVRRRDTFDIMAKLVDAGAEIGKLMELLNNKQRKTVQTEASSVAKADFFFENRLALAVVPQREYKNLDGRGEIVLSMLEQIKGVQYIILLKEQKTNQIGVSLRSRAKGIDEIAVSLGGGGHKFAAGAVVFDSLENVKKTIIEKFKEVI